MFGPISLIPVGIIVASIVFGVNHNQENISLISAVDAAEIGGYVSVTPGTREKFRAGMQCAEAKKVAASSTDDKTFMMSYVEFGELKYNSGEAKFELGSTVGCKTFFSNIFSEAEAVIQCENIDNTQLILSQLVKTEDGFVTIRDDQGCISTINIPSENGLGQTTETHKSAYGKGCEMQWEDETLNYDVYVCLKD